MLIQIMLVNVFYVELDIFLLACTNYFTSFLTIWNTYIFSHNFYHPCSPYRKHSTITCVTTNKCWD